MRIYSPDDIIETGSLFQKNGRYKEQPSEDYVPADIPKHFDGLKQI